MLPLVFMWAVCYGVVMLGHSLVAETDVACNLETSSYSVLCWVVTVQNLVFSVFGSNMRHIFCLFIRESGAMLAMNVESFILFLIVG